jgi:glycosyltransferase involved in cell wall biosynthesis
MLEHSGQQAIPGLEPIRLEPLPDSPLVSVLMANHNYRDYLSQSIESVLNQSYPHFELIVCDDGSTDDSCNVISRYASGDSRVKPVRKPNGGMASAWNAAYSASSGRIYCTLDADDYFAPDKLETIVRHFARRSCSGLVIHPMAVVNATGETVDMLPRDHRFEEGWIAADVLRRGGRWRFMIASALSFRAELTSYLFPIHEEIFRAHADALVFTLSPLLAEVSAVNRVLSYYRVHGRNNLGTVVPDIDTDRKLLDLVSRTVTGVNLRLSELGAEGERLDLQDNLEYLQSAFRICLFDGKPLRDLWRMYASLTRTLLADDIYSTPYKAAGVLAYGIAIALPVGLRFPWWSRVKRAQHLAHRSRDSLSEIVPFRKP